MIQEQEKAVKLNMPRRWYPKHVIVTADALRYHHGQQIAERARQLGIPVSTSPGNRITGIKGKTEAETYRNAKSTLAVVVAPKSQLKLQPIPPSADYQFHLAQGCPAHCQYCYLAGSLSGPPIVRTYANLEEILDNTVLYEKPGQITSFEASCYTDPLALEYLTGSLSATIRHFGQRSLSHLRWVTKFDDVEPLLSLAHNQHTRCRISLNAEEIAKHFEAGTSTIQQRLQALRKLIEAGYPVGVVLAPIIPFEGWRNAYEVLFKQLREILHAHVNATLEFITHRFTPGSKEILLDWYPNTKLSFNEDERSKKFTKFGGVKYVYTKDVMRELKETFYEFKEQYLPSSEVLYWT